MSEPTLQPRNVLAQRGGTGRVGGLGLVAAAVAAALGAPGAHAEQPTLVVPWSDLLAAATAPAAEIGVASPRLPPRVFPVLRPDEPLAAMQVDLPIPLARQTGDKTNCGPTTAAMTLAAFRAEASPRTTRELRDIVGEWTWQAFPLRQMRAPGYDAGMTTREMMRLSLDAFGATADVRFEVLDHPWLPLEAWSVVALKRALAERRPVVVLAEAAPLWDLPRATGLHWVVVRGLADGRVVMNDPADGAVTEVPFERFWAAWRLSDLYRSLPMIAGFEALVADRSLPADPATVVAPPHPAPDALRPRLF